MPEMEVVSAYKYFLKKKIKPKFKLNTIAYTVKNYQDGHLTLHGYSLTIHSRMDLCLKMTICYSTYVHSSKQMHIYSWGHVSVTPICYISDVHLSKKTCILL